MVSRITLKTFSLCFGHSLAFLAILFSLLFQPPEWGALVAFPLGLSYLILALRHHQSYYLYPGGILVSIAYLRILTGILRNGSLLLPYFFPFTFLFLFLGYLFRKRGEAGKGYSMAFEITAHLVPICLGLATLLWPRIISDPAPSFFGLIAFLVLDLWLVKRHKERWFLLPAAIFLFLCFSLLLFILFPHAHGKRGLYSPIIIPAIFFWGLWLKSRKELEYVKPLFTANVLICLFLTLFVFTRKEFYPNLMIILASASVYTLLMMIYKRDDLGYLILFSLGTLGFNFLFNSGNSFYREYYDYLFYGLLVVGVLLLYPALKRWLHFNPGLASYLAQRWMRVFWVFLPVSLGVLFVFFSYGKMFVENPNFCGSCHNMAPFYRAWEKDFHVADRKLITPGNPVPMISPIAREATTEKEALALKPVGCFECHYPPGLSPWLKMKSIGYMELMTFLMGDMSLKPQSQVWDEACLREGCHVKEKLNRNIVFRKGIKFNHEVMISQKVRGIDLRCTTCHSYIGAYRGSGEKHFEVHPSVCYFCHFVTKGEEAGVKVGTCYTCHEPSVDIDPSTFVDVGSGRVTQEKCFMCHEKIERFEDAQYQHDVHINRHKTLSVEKMSTRKVECLDCHTEIQHGNFGKRHEQGG